MSKLSKLLRGVQASNRLRSYRNKNKLRLVEVHALKPGMVAELFPGTLPHVFYSVLDVKTWDGATDIEFINNGTRDIVVRACTAKVAVKDA